MTTFDDIQEIMQMVQAKHNTACSFQHTTYGGRQYTSYISNDIFPAHRSHDSLKGVHERFHDYWKIDDMLAYNKEMLAYAIRDAEEKLDDAQEELQILINKRDKLEDNT